MQNESQFNFNKVKYLITEANSICLITHFNPDGDAIGSSLGLYHILVELGKKVNVVAPNEYPDYLQWLPSNSDVLRYSIEKDIVKKKIDTSDLIICLDFNELRRTGILFEVLEKNKSKKILIDHHPYPQDIFDIQISDISVSSTAELVYETVLKCDFEKHINFNAATCLFAGLLTDTVAFNVNCSNPRTFEIAAKLMSYGLNKEDIHRRLFDNFSANRMRLLGYVLSEKLTIIPEYCTAYMWLTAEELEEYEFRMGDSEGFVNYSLSIKGIHFAALFMQREDHIKISFRSRGNIPVNKIISSHFSGGGHKNAAGGEEYLLGMDETIKKFVSILPLYEDVLNPCKK